MRYGDRTLAGVLFLFGSTQFLLAMLIAEGSLPTYRVSQQAISELGVGPTALLFNASVILLGVSTLAAGYFYHRTHQVLWLTILFFVTGIGPIGVGLFPENTGLPHGIFALLAFLFGGLVAILSSFRTRPPFRYISILLGVVGLVALALFTARQYGGIGFGGMERMIAYPVLFWEIAFGGYLLSMAEPETPSVPPSPPA